MKAFLSNLITFPTDVKKFHFKICEKSPYRWENDDSELRKTKFKHDRQVGINITLRRVRVTIVAVEEQ
jgi:hypothetical protein